MTISFFHHSSLSLYNFYSGSCKLLTMPSRSRELTPSKCEFPVSLRAAACSAADELFSPLLDVAIGWQWGREMLTRLPQAKILPFGCYIIAKQILITFKRNDPLSKHAEIKSLWCCLVTPSILSDHTCAAALASKILLCTNCNEGTRAL